MQSGSLKKVLATDCFGTSRPQVVEREATHRAISHAEIVGVPILIVHVSGREAMEQVRAAARQGKPEAIWEGITSGVFQTFSSDHCPFRYDDPKGKLTPISRTSFRWVPNGIPGVETRLPILFSEGGGGSVSKNSWNCSLPITPGYTAFTRARGRSAWASTPTSSCGITS